MSPLSENSRTVPTICDSCMCQCGVLVQVKDGKALKITGDPDHPYNHGFMCPKGLSALETVYHPDRIIYPLKRDGERGEGEWRRVSWDEALDDIAGRILKAKEVYGAESILYAFGTYPAKNGIPGFVGLLGALDSPGSLSTNCHYCMTPHFIANTLTAGLMYDCEVGYPDFADSRLVVLWGTNPAASFPAIGKKILDAHSRGTRLLVIDPRFTEMASRADLWLQIRPATDAALALGMINIICQENLYDKAFVETWCQGFDQLCKRAQEYPPERVAEITWVPKEKIIEAARLYATIRPSHLQSHNGTTYATNSLQTTRAIALLPALTGNLDVTGGNVFSMPWNYPPVLTYFAMRKSLRPSAAAEDKQLGAIEYPLLAGSKSFRGYHHPPSVYKAMLTGKPYPIKAFINTTNNIISFENSRGVAEALKQLDLLVNIDFFMTPMAEMADYILPPATWLEREDVVDSMTYGSFVCARQKAIEPVGECLDEDQIAFDLIQKMGLKFPLSVDSNRALLDFQLKGTGLNFEQFCQQKILHGKVTQKKYQTGALRGDGKAGFNTPSGKVELYSSRLKEIGQDPLPYYKEPAESYISTPEIARDYPFILIAGSRHIASFNSAGHNIPRLRKILPQPVTDIHPDTARELGIAEGDWLWIKTPRGTGKVKQKAHLTRNIHPKVIHPQSLWWLPETPDREKRWYQHNINTIMSWDGPYDPICGSTLLKGGLCTVEKDKP